MKNIVDNNRNLNQGTKEIDVLVIGAGLTGIYHLYRLLDMGLNAQIYEGGSGIGGTWFWNRYPGARFDSESYTYGYSFSKELLDEWEWSEHFSSQPETERYLNYVVDKFDLRPRITLNSWIKSAIFDPEANIWMVECSDGRQVRTQYIIGSVGPLSAPYIPELAEVDSFEGLTFHTARWPDENVDFRGKRVGVIGTGPTAVQMIPELAQTVEHLTIFQRSPGYCVPLHNSKIKPEEQKKIKSSYAEIFDTCNKTLGGFLHNPMPVSVFDVTEEEREANFERLYAEPGFAKWFGNYHDILTNKEANELYCEFLRQKIRERVNDPGIAEKLCPKDYPFGAKRVPLETNYYEAYNRDNVLLIDVKKNTIEKFTPKGIQTLAQEHELDIIIFATGFDALDGQFSKIHIEGLGGKTLKEHWINGPRSNLGVLSSGFPNFFIANLAFFCNVPRCAESVGSWICDLIGYMKKNGFNRIDTTREAEDKWQENLELSSSGLIKSETSSWYFGSNIPGKKIAFSVYIGLPMFKKIIAEVAANGYEGLEIS